ALGLSGTGSTTGVNIYNTAGSAVNAFLGYDNTNSKMLINVANGSFAIKTGGSERFNLGTDGTVTVNGAVFLDASKNVTANGGSFSGVVNAGGGLQVGGTTVIDTSRNIAGVNNITAAGNATITGTANVGSLQIGGTTAIDGSRNGSLTTLVTSGGITANGGINTSTLTATGQIVAPAGSTTSPSYTFTGSSTTGLYSPSANTLGLVAGGTQVLSATSSGVNLPAGLNVSGGNLVLSGPNVTGTLAARPAAGVANRVYVTTDTDEIYRDTGAAWVRVGGATSLSGMSDWGVVSPTNGQALVYNSATGKWTNGLTLQANATGFSVAGGTTSKTLQVNNTIALAGTDGTTMTFPSTSATVARTDAAQTFSGLQTFSGGVAVTGGNVTVTNDLSARTLDMSYVATAGASCSGFSSGAIANSSTGAVLSCQAGVWAMGSSTSLHAIGLDFISRFGIWGVPANGFVNVYTSTSACGAGINYPAYPTCPAGYTLQGNKQASATCTYTVSGFQANGYYASSYTSCLIN
ncbi:M18 family aminopeptidase, partial [Novimethylophilus kurashikiensis]